MTLEALAVRCEAGLGGDREIDSAIAAELCGGSVDIEGRYWKPGVRGFCLAPSYTASIDAAMKLVPEGFGKIYKRGSKTGWWRVQIYSPDDRLYWSGDACTEALALTAAALRAHLLAQKEHTPS